MKHKDRTGTGTSGRLQCGCQTLMTSNELCKPQLQRQWTNTISFQDLKTGLGPSSEAWFENLTSEHEWHQREIVPANRQTGWSPCPSGGVLIVSASTPCPVKKVLQYNSPALWPTLLSETESPVLESTTLSKSASSEDDGHNNSTATSLGFGLDGFDGDGGGDRHQLLAFSMDSADLSWSSSMATPPNAAVEKFSVTEEEERQKGPARVLFSPNTSAADSELGETDANITIEQEEASTSLFAPDLPLAAPQGTCPCKTTERREMSGSGVRAKPCSCEQCQVPVVEIHCSGNKSTQSPLFDENLYTNSDAWKESGVQDRVPGSLLPEVGWSSPLGEGEERVPLWRTSTPRTGRFKALSLREDRPCRDACSTRRCHSLTSTPVRKGGTLSACVRQLDAPLERPLIGQRFAVSTPGTNHISSDLIPDGAGGESKSIPKRPHQPNCHDILKAEVVGLDLKASVSSADFPDQTADGSGWQTPGQGRFNTSAPKSDASLSSAMLSVNDPPMSPALHRHRKSLSKRGTRKNLANAHESEKTDFFSSPETSAKWRRHAPGKGVKRESTGSALENLDKEEPVPAVAEADTEHDSGKDHSSAFSKVGAERSPQSGHVLVEKSVRNGQTGLQTTTRVSDYPFEEAEAGIPNSDEATNQNVLIKNSTSCKTDIINNGFGKTPVKGDTANHAYPRTLSTPPSILRSSGKQRQMSSSSKRVRFAADCKGKALTLKSKDKLRRRLATPDDVGEKEQKDVGQASVVTTVCSNNGGSECEVKNGDGKEWEKVLAASPSLTEDCFAPTLLTSETATTPAAENVKTLDATRLQTTQVCTVGTESATTSRSLEPLVYPDRDEVRTRSAKMPSLAAPDKAGTESAPLREGEVQGQVQVNNVQSLVKSHNVQSLLKSPPSHEKVPWSGNSGPMNQARGSVGKTPVAETSQDSGGTVGVQSKGRISTVEPQSVEITEKIQKEATSGGKKAENALPPAKSVAPPKLRLGLRKTPRFLYPSSSQIMETCPQNVYDFNAPGVAVKPPADSVCTKDAGDRLSTTPEGRHPVLTAPSEDLRNTASNASNQTAAIAPKSPALATSSTLSTPNKNENASESYTNGKNSHAEMDREGNSKGKEDILFKVYMEYKPMVMEEEPDWSEIDDCAMEECDIETALLADGQKLTTTLYETMCEMAQVPARGKPQAEGEESSIRRSTLGKAAAASKEAAPPTLSEVASTLRASCSPAEQTDACSSTAALPASTACLSPTTGSPPVQPSSAAYSLLSAPHLTATPSSPTTGSPPAQPSSSAASSLPPAPHLTARGSVSTTLKTQSASLQALSSSLPTAATGARPGIGGRQREGGPPAADQPADLEEDLQTELLCDVDFSQELLSQSKCGAETEQETETGGAEIEQEAENGGVEIEQEAENGGVETEQEAENGGVETEQEAENGGVETEQEAKNGGVETEQEAENGGVETEQEAENGSVETEQEAENGGVEIEQETETGGVETEQETEDDGIETEQKKETGGLTMKLNNRRMLPKSVATEGSVLNMNSEMPTDDGTESDCQTANEISASEKLCAEALRMSMSTNSVVNMLENSPEKPVLCPQLVKFCGGVLPSEASPMPEFSRTVQNLQLKQTPKPSSGPCLQGDQASGMLGIVSSAVPGGYAGFRSAAGRLVKPTEKALATAEALFQEEDVAVDKACSHSNVKKASDSWSCHSDPKDFSHRLPERPPRTAKRFLDSYQSVGVSASCNTDDMHKTADTSKFSGFKSARGKDVVLSSKGQRKAEEMWKAVEKELQSDESLPCDADSDSAVVALSLDHESTISAKTKMSHSYSIPSKAARLSGEGSAHCNVSDGAERPGLGFEMLADDVGFKTAGGKAVSLSSKAQQRAVELWKCVEKELSVSADSLQVQDAQPSFPASEMLDFPVPLLSKHGSLVTSVEVTEKAELNLSFKAPLLSGPYHNVPQGFRPFKPPKLTKKEPDGERCKSQETEQSKGTQKNTILHHFSKVDLKEENNVSKRKHSDDFSDDDDEYVWDIESMEQMGCKENCQLDEDRTVEPSTGAEPQVSRAGENQSQIQQARHHAREELGSEKNVAQSANSLTRSPCNVDANHNSTNPTDEEMSDAVLTELSRDMYELTQAESMPQKLAPSLSVQNEKHAFSDSHLGLDEQFLRQCSGAPLDIPSQGSRKSLGMVSVSFESLRCDENVSYEEKDSTTSHADLNYLSNCEEEAPDDDQKQSGFAQGMPLQIREPDFDSSIPDQIADSTFSDENMRGESFGEGQDQEIDSSDLEQDMLDISCLEKELDTSQVEVSGGVVWMEGKDCCEWDSVSGADAAAATLVSLDAIKEEKSSGGGLEETENGPLEASGEMKGLEEVLSEAFDADEACAAVDTETVEGKLVKRKAELVTPSSDKTLSRSPKRPKTVAVGEDPGSCKQRRGESSDEPSDTSDGVFIEGNPEEGGTTTSPVDSLANLSWTDIASPFTPSQWRGGKHSKPGHMPEQRDETDDGEQQHHGQQTDAGGDLRVPVPFSAYSSSPKVIEESEPGFNKTAGSSSKVDSVFAVTRSDEVEEDAMKDGDALHASLEHDGDANQFGADSEGFQITAGLSQLFSTQISQVMVAGKQTSFGDAPPEDAGLKTSSIRSVHHQNSSSQQEDTQQADDADSAVLASRADATSNLKDAHKLLTLPGDIFRSDTLCQGFRTARGNLLRVSKKSLEKVQSLFQSDSESAEGLAAGSIRPGTSGEPLLARPHGPVRLPVPSAMQLKTADVGPVQSPQPGLGASSRGGALSVVSKSSEKVNSIFETEKASLAMTKDTSSSSLGFGFQTASGKAVVVSVKSVERVRHLFDDDSEVENLDRTMKPVSSSLVATSQSFSGFKTAEGRNVAVSETSLNHVRLMLEQDQPHGSGKGYTDGKFSPPKVGFQTARVENETVGDNSLSNARGLFQAGTGQAGMTMDEAHLHQSSSPAPGTFQGFQTASRTNVSVSKNALDHVRGLFSSDNSGEHVVQAKEEEQIVPRCAGFQTAGGGKVTVSAKSLHHAKAVLAECSEKQGFSSENEGSGSNETALATRNVGFQTASGVKVSVSMKSLWHARKVLDSTESKDVDEISGLTLSKNGMGDSDALAGPSDQKFHGFQTAGGKSVSVSENALKNARKVLGSSENSSSSTQLAAMESEGAEINPPVPQALGFQTAQGGNVSLSTRALQHAQRILRSDEELGTAQSLEPEALKPETVGFQTAGGDHVSVSHRSLQRAQNLLKDDAEKQTSGSLLSRGTSPEVRSPAPPSNEPGVDQHAPRTTHLPPSHSRADDFTVPTCQLAPSPETSPHQQQPHTEAMVLLGCHSSSTPMRGLGRRGKECLQPVVSDDSRVLTEGGEEEETSRPGHVKKDAAAQQRVAVKRTALYADSEAILHDRSAKRFKLKAATAHEDGVQNVSLPHPLPRMPHHSSMPRCTMSGKSVPAFQPPYKKAKFTPPAAKKAGEGACTDTSGKPGYRPPPTLPTPHHAPAEARPVSSAQRLSPGKTQSRGGMSRLSSSAAEVPADLSEVDGKLAESEGGGPSSGLQVQKESCGKDQPCSAGEEPAKRQPGSEGATVLGRSRSERNVDQSELAGGGSFGLEEARMRQEKIIRQRKRQKVRPVQGRWLAQKSTQPQMNLEDLPLVTKWRCRKELLRLGVSPAVCSVSSRNAEEFRFHLPSFYPGNAVGILVGDGALLVADRHGYAGKEEFYSAFLTVEGVDPGLVPEAWLSNHYRWIVWKLAAYEVALPHSFSARALTPDVVMFQLKYRYDREVDGCQRSALKRIVEGDDTPCKRMVLCVSDLKYTEEAEAAMLEVTDGWYCLPCKPDSALQDLIGRKKLAVGQKIVTTGAELAGSQESCSPLEICAGLHLKVFGNSTRPAPAAAKLGYQGCPTPLCVPLSTLHPRGGLVGCLDIVVVRKYPLMFMEKLSGGGCVFRTLEMEEKAQRKHEEKRQTIMEKLCSQLQAQMEREEESTKRGCRKRSLRQQEVQSLTTGAEISAAMDSVPHPEELQGMLSGSQMARLLDYRQRQQEEHQQQLRERLQEALQQSSSQVERCVVPLQKLRIVGCCRRDIDSKTGMMLTVWRPGQDWESVREGEVPHLLPDCCTCQVSRFSGLLRNLMCRSLGQHVEVTAGRQTRLKALSVDENLLDLVYEPREVYSVADLQQKAPPYSEFDFVGVVISIKTALRGSDAVYAADIKGDLLLIWFWGGLQAFSLQGTLAEGAVFAASNLRFKSCRKDSVESCASLELSHFSLGGKTAAQRLMLQPFQQKDWKTQLFEQGREKLSRLKSASKPSAAPASEMLEDLPPSFVEKLLAPLTQESSIDTRSQAPSKEPSLNTSADDSFSASNTSLNTSAACTQALSPGALETRRKMKAQKEKLARLQSYNRPPPLSPLPCILSPAATNAFKPPTPQRR